MTTLQDLNRLGYNIVVTTKGTTRYAEFTSTIGEPYKVPHQYSTDFSVEYVQKDLIPSIMHWAGLYYKKVLAYTEHGLTGESTMAVSGLRTISLQL